MDGNQRYALYDTFIVGDENSLYNMSIGGFSGTIDRDQLVKCNGDTFVTFDRDRNNYATNKHKSGWWFCYYTNLNGIMKERTYLDLEQRYNSDRDHVYWLHFRASTGYRLLRKTRMSLILKTPK